MPIIWSPWDESSHFSCWAVVPWFSKVGINMEKLRPTGSTKLTICILQERKEKDLSLTPETAFYHTFLPDNYGLQHWGWENSNHSLKKLNVKFTLFPPKRPNPVLSTPSPPKSFHNQNSLILHFSQEANTTSGFSLRIPFGLFGFVGVICWFYRILWSGCVCFIFKFYLSWKSKNSMEYLFVELGTTSAEE